MAQDLASLNPFQRLLASGNILERERRRVRTLFETQFPQLLGFENENEFLGAWIVSSSPTADFRQKSEAAAILSKYLDAGDGPNRGSSGPSTAQQAAGIQAELENLAGLFGLAPQDWSSLAWTAASNNWNAAMIRNAVADQIDMQAASRAGLVKNVITKSRDVGANYFVNVNNEEALGWAKKIARGEMEEESIVATLRDRAKQQYYWLAPVIDQGVSLKEYFQPHRETIAKLMEVSADSIDFINNSKWRNVIRFQPPDQNGVREMNINELEQYVRQQDEWKATSNAKSTGAAAAVAIGQIFGAL
ncbi:MAG: hypothetical protein EBR30_12020 [Cytophagia bacterium]|nr:hypothetical protein [Cytophagia bacterium]